VGAGFSFAYLGTGSAMMLSMSGFVIIPRNRRYWIEAIADDGSRRPVEAHVSEEAAVRRLRLLNERQDAIEQRKALHARVPPSWQPAATAGSDDDSSVARRRPHDERAAA
jgi:hypothetical protein